MTRVFISYDYELLWGVWDGTSPSYVARNVAQANEVMDGLLALHQRLNVPATFAIVGALLAKDKPETVFAKAGRSQADIARIEKDFTPHLDKGDVTGINQDALAVLKADPLFEIGSHTFSHFYALNADATLIEQDFALFNDVVTAELGHKVTSLVMPKNQVTEPVLGTLSKFGITVVRMNPDSWLYRPVVHTGLKAKIIRVLRFADTFVPLLECCPDKSARIAKRHDVRINKGQYFMRPFMRFEAMNWLHRQRLKLGLRLCRLMGKDCHYWSHPHNFGANPQKALENAQKLFQWLKKQEAKGKITLHRMDET